MRLARLPQQLMKRVWNFNKTLFTFSYHKKTGAALFPPARITYLLDRSVCAFEEKTGLRFAPIRMMNIRRRQCQV